MPHQVRDGCTSLLTHYSMLTCTDTHHCGPMYREGVRVLCGECGRLVDIIPVTTQSTRKPYRNRFIPVCGVAQS
jgi:hypothetical protein